MLLFSASAAVFAAPQRKAQHAQFKVMRGEDVIGTIRISEVSEDNKVAYFLHSDVKVKLVMNVSVVESIADVYEEDRLSQSVHTRYVNGKIKANNVVKRAQSGYHISSVEQQEQHLAENIPASILTLYYKEPAPGHKIYSQAHRTMLEVRQTGTGRYQVDTPGGDHSVYIYEKGVLQMVECYTAWGKIVFKREA